MNVDVSFIKIMSFMKTLLFTQFTQIQYFGKGSVLDTVEYIKTLITREETDEMLALWLLQVCAFITIYWFAPT